MLGNGMYNVTGGRYTKFTGSFGELKLILHLRVDYTDGSTDSVVSDESWRASSGHDLAAVPQIASMFR
jgi:hypothetical protein